MSDINALESYLQVLQAQDEALRVSSCKEISLQVSYTLNRLFNEINEAFPNLNLAFEANGQAIALRSQLSVAVGKISARIRDLRPSSGHAASAPTDPKDVFVIHGRQLLLEFHDFLRALALKPLEWCEARRLTGNPNPYAWEIVDTALSRAGAIVALLTPDDEARLIPQLWSADDNVFEKDHLRQPRQNVLFEAGVAYGRAPQRTVLVRVGSHRPMSDLAGHHILQLDDSPQSRQAVAAALRTAGCPVEVSGTDWLSAGEFSLAEQEETRKASGGARVDTLQIKQDAAILLLYKTQLKGFTDLPTAASVVTGIHNFFVRCPQYLNPANVAFLEKYPGDFRDKVCSNTAKWASLAELKRDVDLLHIDFD